MAKPNVQAQIGIFIFLGLLIFVVVIFSIGGPQIFKPGYTIKARFGYIGGLNKGSPVRLAGLAIGEVKRIDLVQEDKTKKTQVELDLFIQQEKHVEKDAQFRINQLGFFGERYVEIEGGTPGGAILAPGDRVIGQDPIPWDKVQEDLAGMIREGREVVTSLKNVVEDTQAQEGLRKALRESGDAVSTIKQVSERADRMLAKLERGEGTIGKLMFDDALYNDLSGFAADVRRNPWKLLYKTKEKKADSN